MNEQRISVPIRVIRGSNEQRQLGARFHRAARHLEHPRTTDIIGRVPQTARGAPIRITCAEQPRIGRRFQG